MLKSDRWIVRMCRDRRLIDPFEPGQVKTLDSAQGPQPAISWGVSSYGYDIRLAAPLRVLDPSREPGVIIDPKRFDFARFATIDGPVCTLPPHGLAVVQSLEYFRIPREILAVCFGKSTYARCGIQVSIAPLEPEWEGRLTFSVVNTTGQAARLYAGEGIAQVLFLEASEVCLTSYADRKGKYQKQEALTPPRVG